MSHITQAARVLREWILAALGLLGFLTTAAFGLLLVAGLAIGVWKGFTDYSTAVTTPAQTARRESDPKLLLCREAAACKKYSEARLECATAGNFINCLRIKMGEDAIYSGVCGGFDEGAPAVPLPPETPNAFQCFLRRMFM
jgi:hypothetical protein